MLFAAIAFVNPLKIKSIFKGSIMNNFSVLAAPTPLVINVPTFVSNVFNVAHGHRCRGHFRDALNALCRVRIQYDTDDAATLSAMRSIEMARTYVLSGNTNLAIRALKKVPERYRNYSACGAHWHLCNGICAQRVSRLLWKAGKAFESNKKLAFAFSEFQTANGCADQIYDSDHAELLRLYISLNTCYARGLVYAVQGLSRAKNFELVVETMLLEWRTRALLTRVGGGNSISGVIMIADLCTGAGLTSPFHA